MSQFTRRELGAALTASTGLLALKPQAVRAQSTNPEDELKASRDQLRDAANQLDRFPLAMDVEPATIFKP